MRKIKMLALAMGLAFVASQGSQPAVAGGWCEGACYNQYRECQVFCSKNPCLVACEDQLRYCLNGCTV